MEWQCKRCGYMASTKGNLIKHYQRKTQCDATVSNISPLECLEELCKKTYEGNVIRCEYCQKQFKSASCKSKHKKICKKKPEDKVKSLEDKVKKLEEALQNLTYHQSPSSPQVNLYGGQHINQGNQLHQVNHITIHAVGREDIAYLTEHARYPEFMIRCIRDKVEGVCNFLLKKHFDPAHPENHNLKKTNRKDPFIECFDGRKWKVRFCEDVLEDIFINIQTDFANFVDQAFAENGTIKKVWMDNFMKQVGVPLDWDLSNDGYTFQETMSEEDKKNFRKKIYLLACEYIYRHSKEVAQAAEP